MEVILYICEMGTRQICLKSKILTMILVVLIFHEGHHFTELSYKGVDFSSHPVESLAGMVWSFITGDYDQHSPAEPLSDTSHEQNEESQEESPEQDETKKLFESSGDGLLDGLLTVKNKDYYHVLELINHPRQIPTPPPEG